MRIIEYILMLMDLLSTFRTAKLLMISQNPLPPARHAEKVISTMCVTERRRHAAHAKARGMRLKRGNLFGG